MPYDMVKDFAPITLLATTPNLLVINNDVPAKTLEEFIELGKKRGKMTFASSGSGTSIHVSGELFKTMTGIDMKHIPYKGRASAIPDLLGGRVTMMFDNMPSSLPLVKEGKLRALGVTSASARRRRRRSRRSPNRACPASRRCRGSRCSRRPERRKPVDRQAAGRGEEDPERRTSRRGSPRSASRPVGSTPDELAAYQRAEIAKWAKVVKDRARRSRMSGAARSVLSPDRRRASARRRCACTLSVAGTSSSTVRATSRPPKRSPKNAARSVPMRSSFSANVAADADCRRLAAEVEARFGRVDVLVNNAGTTKFVAPRDLDGLDADDFQRIYAVNVIGAYQMVRALQPMLVRQPGAAIVNVSSIASMMGTGSSLAYMASKGALNALTSASRARSVPRSASTRSRPAWSRPPGCRRASAPSATRRPCRPTSARAALDAVITPEDVAEAAWFLGASAAKTTGEVVLLDAGVRLGRG